MMALSMDVRLIDDVQCLIKKSLLGVEFDPISLEARLPPEKIQKVTRQISAILDKGTITRREAEELAGRLQWYSGGLEVSNRLTPKGRKGSPWDKDITI